jgi:acetyl-CoA carboxylase biotin carboxyl carrier protein
MDLRKLKTLIDLVQQSGIAELEITEGEERVRISRGATAAPVAAAPPVTLVPFAPADTSTAAPAAAESHVLKSPMVGTFYRAAAPGSNPFVELGQAVKAGDVVCIIEAMKLLNEIEADRDGIVKTILVDNGQPVEYGQPLMIIT